MCCYLDHYPALPFSMPASFSPSLLVWLFGPAINTFAFRRGKMTRRLTRFNVGIKGTSVGVIGKLQLIRDKIRYSS